MNRVEERSPVREQACTGSAGHALVAGTGIDHSVPGWIDNPEPVGAGDRAGDESQARFAQSQRLDRTNDQAINRDASGCHCKDRDHDLQPEL